MGLPPPGDTAPDDVSYHRNHGGRNSARAVSNDRVDPVKGQTMAVVLTTPSSGSGPQHFVSDKDVFINSVPSVGSPGRGGNDKPLRNETGSASVLASRFANKTIFAQLAYANWFQNTTLAIVCLNSLWIGIDTQWNHKNMADDDGRLPLEPTSTVVENAFCFYFTVEVLIRFLAFRQKSQCWRDGWFVFDGALVFAMVLETWVLEVVQKISGSDGGGFLSNFSALRLLRLLRLTRMARLMRQVPELVTLCKGIMSATKAVCWVLFFLLGVMYVFGIMFTSIIGEAPSHEFGDMDEDAIPESAKYLFGTLGDSMMSLFTLGVLGDNMAPTWDSLIAWRQHEIQSYMVQWLYFIFFCISSLTLLNMLIGVLCEVITQTAEDEKETAKINELRWCIEDAFGQMDLNSDGHISQAEWTRIKENENVLECLEEMGVEPEIQGRVLDQMESILFDKQFGLLSKLSSKDKGLKMEDLMQRLTEIRPDKEASALEVIVLENHIKSKDKWFKKRLKAIQESVAQICRLRGIDPNQISRSSVSLNSPTCASSGSHGSPVSQTKSTCPKCGEEIRPHYKFCEECGFKVAGAKQECSPKSLQVPGSAKARNGPNTWAQPSLNSHAKMTQQGLPQRAQLETLSLEPISPRDPKTPAKPTQTASPKEPPPTPAKPHQAFEVSSPPPSWPPPSLGVSQSSGPASIRPDVTPQSSQERSPVSGDNTNLRDMPIEQLIQVLRRRDPALLKGIAHSNDQREAQQRREPLIERPGIVQPPSYEPVVMDLT